MIASIHVTGTSFPNESGPSRQAILRGCREGDPVVLVREPQNQYDPNAVAVMVDAGQIGYVPALVAQRITAAEIAQQWQIETMLGGTAAKPSIGCRIAPASTAETEKDIPY